MQLALYDDEDTDAWLPQHYSAEVVAACHQLKVGAAKADLWRYLVRLHVPGTAAEKGPVPFPTPTAQHCGREGAYPLPHAHCTTLWQGKGSLPPPALCPSLTTATPQSGHTQRF